MRTLLVLATLSAFACSAAPAGDDLCPTPDVAGLRPELFFATAVPEERVERSLGSSLLGALSGAAPDGETFAVYDAAGSELARGSAEIGGRLRVGLSAAAGEVVELERSGDRARVPFCVRDPAEARAAAVLAPIDGAGSVPNDLIIVGPPDRARGVLVRSGDNAVGVFDLQRGLDGAPLGVRLPDVEDRCGVRRANPWFAAPLDAEGRRVAVTAYGQGRVYLVDLDRGAVDQTLEMRRTVQLESPFALARELDVDCDGVAESQIQRFVPGTPQAITVAGGRLVATYSSFVWPQPPVFLPGTLAVWSLADLDAGPQLIVLPAFNPQELRALDDDRVLVVCTGVIDPSGERVDIASPGAAVIVDLRTGAVERTYDLGDFAPGTALIAGGSLWVGSIARGAVRRVDLESGAVLDELALSEEVIDSVFRLVELPGGLIGAPSFDTDRLYVIDAHTGELSPPPFFGPLLLGPGQPIPDGLQILARRPGRAGIDFTGAELFALSGPASRVRPIELARVLGP